MERLEGATKCPWCGMTWKTSSINDNQGTWIEQCDKCGRTFVIDRRRVMMITTYKLEEEL